MPVSEGLASGALVFSTVCCALDTGLLASLVLSTLASPTSVLVMPVGLLTTGLVSVLFTKV